MERTDSPRYVTRFCPGAFWFPLCFRLFAQCSFGTHHGLKVGLSSFSTAFVFLLPTSISGVPTSHWQILGPNFPLVNLESEPPTGKSWVRTCHWWIFSPNVPLANLESELATAKSWFPNLPLVNLESERSNTFIPSSFFLSTKCIATHLEIVARKYVPKILCRHSLLYESWELYFLRAVTHTHAHFVLRNSDRHQDLAPRVARTAFIQSGIGSWGVAPTGRWPLREVMEV